MLWLHTHTHTNTCQYIYRVRSFVSAIFLKISLSQTVFPEFAAESERGVSCQIQEVGNRVELSFPQ